MRLSLSDRILDARVPREVYVRRGKPSWLRMQLPHSERYGQLKKLIADNRLHTVCQEAACPNMGECWSNGVATVMILGDTCTRSCGFCHVKTGRPPLLDTDEPRRVAEAIRIMDLSYVVITSVNRDELADGGASIWAETIRRTRDAAPDTKIEVLIPDFCGDWDALQAVIDARPDVLAHNMETVRRLYPVVRPQAKYHRSIELLRRASEQGLVTKTGFMVGLGETDEEVTELMADLVEGVRAVVPLTSVERRGVARPRAARASYQARPATAPQRRAESALLISIGQYLQPSPDHLPVSRFVHPDRFAEYKRIGESMGATHIEAGPMVRSSYHADKQAAAAQSVVGV
jgi:lipoyl synthase